MSGSEPPWRALLAVPPPPRDLLAAATALIVFAAGLALLVPAAWLASWPLRVVLVALVAAGATLAVVDFVRYARWSAVMRRALDAFTDDVSGRSGQDPPV